MMVTYVWGRPSLLRRQDPPPPTPSLVFFILASQRKHDNEASKRTCEVGGGLLISHSFCSQEKDSFFSSHAHIMNYTVTLYHLGGKGDVELFKVFFFFNFPLFPLQIQLASVVENIRDKLAENIHEMWAVSKIENGEGKGKESLSSSSSSSSS